MIIKLLEESDGERVKELMLTRLDIIKKRWFKAIDLGNVAELLQLFLNVGRKSVLIVNEMDASSGLTGLMKAVRKGHITIVKVLLHHKEGINVNIQNKDGVTALIIACRDGHTEIVELILSHKNNRALPNIKSEGGWNALILASLSGHTEVVRLLLRVPSCGVDDATKDGLTALIFAANNGHLEVVKLLVEYHADLDAKTSVNHNTALIFATDAGHSEIVRILLQNGASVDAQNKGGITALIRAAIKYGADISILKMLLQHGADLSLMDANGRDALTLARERVVVGRSEAEASTAMVVSVIEKEGNWRRRRAWVIFCSAYRKGERGHEEEEEVRVRVRAGGGAVRVVLCQEHIIRLIASYL